MSNIEFTNKYTVCSPKEQTAYPISNKDWNRLKRMVGQIIPHTNYYQNALFCCIGIAITAIFALITFACTPNPLNWAVTFCWALLASSVVLAIACVIGEKYVGSKLTVSKDHILDEMKSIEDNFVIEEKLKDQ